MLWVGVECIRVSCILTGSHLSPLLSCCRFGLAVSTFCQIKHGNMWMTDCLPLALSCHVKSPVPLILTISGLSVQGRLILTLSDLLGDVFLSNLQNEGFLVSLWWKPTWKDSERVGESSEEKCAAEMVWNANAQWLSFHGFYSIKQSSFYVSLLSLTYNTHTQTGSEMALPLDDDYY